MFNIFKPKAPTDKFLMQFSMDCGAGVNSGLSINLPAGTDIGTLHNMADKMRRVLDRQRAITELPAFQSKLDILAAQLETTKKDVVKFQAQADEEEAKGGAPKTVTANMLTNLTTNIEKMEADYKLGESSVANIKRRIESVTEEDLVEINKLSAAA